VTAPKGDASVHPSDVPPPGALALLLPLAAAAACADAFSYLGLGRVFTANMTGNTILLTLAIAQRDVQRAIRSGLAVAGFVAGAGAGTALMRGRGRRIRPSELVKPLIVECGLTAVVLISWAVAGGVVHGWANRLLIVLIGGAMGLQSAGVGILPGTGVTTTFLTGTWTDLAHGIVRPGGVRHRSFTKLRGAIILTYAAGALLGAVLMHVAAYWCAPALSIALLIAAIAVARRNPGLMRETPQR
jgi:uncharacterized membrane protein YoaK (UPF0700 family)